MLRIAWCTTADRAPRKQRGVHIATVARNDRPTALFLIHDLRPGGAEKALLDIVRRLRTVRPVVVLVRPGGAWIERVPANVPLYHLEATGVTDTSPETRGRLARAPLPPTRRGWVASAGSLARKAARLRAVMEAEGADVVSTFLHKSHAIALMACRSTSAPRLVVNVHEQPLDHLERHFTTARRALMERVYRDLLPRVDRVVAVSEGIATELTEGFGIPRRRIAVVPNPVDAGELEDRASRPLPFPLPDTPIILALGRLERVKGMDLLLEAFRRIHTRTPAELVIVGDGSRRSALEQQARDLGVSRRVRFTGYLDEPLPLVKAATLLALPSRSEAWPTVVVEAMALGTPVVATRCSPGVASLLGDGANGRLVPAEEPEVLGEAILALLDDEAARASFAEAARRRIATFEAPAVVARYEQLLIGTEVREPS